MQMWIVVVMLVSVAAEVRDLSGKMFVFPEESSSGHVMLSTSQMNSSSLTVCHRSFTELRTPHAFFSLATPTPQEDFLVSYDEQMLLHVCGVIVGYKQLDYTPNVWHTMCTTWDKSTGLVQLWFNKRPLSKRFTFDTAHTGPALTGPAITVLGQKQDTYGGGFSPKHPFMGMLSDVHMWDYVLSPCDIQRYMSSDDKSYTPGNIFSWRALDFEITGKVFIEDKQKCGLSWLQG